MHTPLIGITTYQSTNQYGHPITAIGQYYIRAVSQAGGLAVLIPSGLSEDQLTALTARLDGIIFSGGGDIDPASYGAESTPEVKLVNPERDRAEFQMVHEAIDTNLPFLGICRGLQVINVTLGGTLYTHILTQHPQELEHAYYPDWPRDHLAHSVRVKNGSRLAEILGTDEVKTNSLHHQGIRVLSPELQPTAWAPDELIEAVELPNHPFGLGVQWHPEWLPAHAPMRALFSAFVEAARHHSPA